MKVTVWAKILTVSVVSLRLLLAYVIDKEEVRA